MARPHARRAAPRSRKLCLLGLAAFLFALPEGVAAVDLYATGRLHVSTADGDSSGETTFFPLTGGDDDQTPAWGGSLGVSLGLDEVFQGLHERYVPSWKLRFELEGSWGRDYEFRTEGGDGFFTEVESHSIMPSVWIDIPVHDPISRIFGRIPVLEPLSLYAGGGIGWVSLDAKTTDNISDGSDETTELGTQWGFGLSYDITRQVTFSLGYRNVGMGEVEMDLIPGVGLDPIGTYELEMEAHEIVSSIRINFYSFPFPSWRDKWGEE